MLEALGLIAGFGGLIDFFRRIHSTAASKALGALDGALIVAGGALLSPEADWRWILYALGLAALAPVVIDLIRDNTATPLEAPADDSTDE